MRFWRHLRALWPGLDDPRPGRPSSSTPSGRSSRGGSAGRTSPMLVARPRRSSRSARGPRSSSSAPIRCGLVGAALRRDALRRERRRLAGARAPLRPARARDRALRHHDERRARRRCTTGSRSTTSPVLDRLCAIPYAHVHLRLHRVRRLALLQGLPARCCASRGASSRSTWRASSPTTSTPPRRPGTSTRTAARSTSRRTRARARTSRASTRGSASTTSPGMYGRVERRLRRHAEPARRLRAPRRARGLGELPPLWRAREHRVLLRSCASPPCTWTTTGCSTPSRASSTARRGRGRAVARARPRVAAAPPLAWPSSSRARRAVSRERAP